jgi:hypothetical protein
MGLQMDFEKQPDGLCREGFWDSSEGLGACSTTPQLPFPLHTTHFDFVLRNLTEEALAGGGFYSPEGFPFSNM